MRTQNSGSCSKSIGLQRLSRLLFPHLLLRQLLPVVAMLQRLVLVGLLLHYLLSKFSFTPSEDCLNPRLKHIVRLIVFSVRTSCHNHRWDCRADYFPRAITKPWGQFGTTEQDNNALLYLLRQSWKAHHDAGGLMQCTFDLDGPLF